MRWLRRWWARITHKHDWVVIWHGMYVDTKYGIPTKQRCQIKRCSCGFEEGWHTQWHTGEWCRLTAVEFDDLNDQILRKGIEIPARHQE